LKAPLRAIDGFSLAIKEDYYDIIDDEGKEYISLIRNNAQKMGQLINDLLAFSRMGRKSIEYSDIDVKELSLEVFEELMQETNERRINLLTNSSCSIRGDRKMLKQVFINLLSNAIKFTKNIDEAIIEVGCSINGNDNEIFVKDNGVGFDMKYMDKLFGVFQRLHSDEDFEGTGVGLALVKRILAKHQGKIWAEGKVNEGAIFHFCLPIPDEMIERKDV
jgi:light-regulated signal transduction histidine kinase (bacteriophytochrome)